MARARSILFISNFTPHRLPCLPIRPCSNSSRLMAAAPAAPNRMFQLRQDPLTGESQWVVVVEEEDEGNDQQSLWSPSKSFLSSTSYLDMLNDSRRNKAFHEAIRKAVAKRPGCHVLDIGAGTGLLSMMAARALVGCEEGGACSGAARTVYACESYLPMVKLMRRVLRDNGMEKKIRVFNKRSDELKVGLDLPSRADVLVSEILDSELLGEGLIPTLQHAHDELLIENPITVPYKATTYGQLVECSFLRKLHDLHGSEVLASDGVHLSPSGSEDIIRIKHQQYSMHSDGMLEEIRLLSKPFKIFDFDFWKRPDSYGIEELHVKTTSDGTVHGVISWWVLQLDYEGKIFYSTAPQWISSTNILVESSTDFHGSSGWCDHWKQCVWFTPGEGVPVRTDGELLIQACHDAISISYDIIDDKQRKRLHESEFGDYHLMLSPERIAIYGDIEWRASMLKAIISVFQSKHSPLCVVVDDSVFLTILAASLSKNSCVISLFPGLQEKGLLYLQAVASANGFSMDQVEVRGRKKLSLTLDDTNGKKVDLLVGEPFYYGNEGMLPWQNLRFWKERTRLDLILSEDVVVMPCRGILKACAMSLPDLWTSRRGLKDVEGFDHSIVNESLGACGDCSEMSGGPCLPYYIWQCGQVKELSEVSTIMEMDFSKPITTCYGKVKVRFTVDGICHGFAIWIDWVMDAKNSIVVSTGPVHRYWKQGVKLLNKPVAVSNYASSEACGICSAAIEATFDPSNGELAVEPCFSITEGTSQF